MPKPKVYIASPYTIGSRTINAEFQCKIFNRLLDDGIVTPIAPLWSHFQHCLFPRPYKDWLDYDLEMIPLYDACLRLNVVFPGLNYLVSESNGADREVELFNNLHKPVFLSIEALYGWAKND